MMASLVVFWVYAWAGLSMALMWRETEQRYISPFLLVWVAVIWPVVPVLWLIDMIDGGPDGRS